MIAKLAIRPGQHLDLYRHPGLTLIELLAVVAILAILLGLAIPTYQSHVIRVCHGEAALALEELAGQQEQFYFYNLRYASTAAQLQWPDRSERHNYRLELGSPGGQAISYTAIAIPVGEGHCATSESTKFRIDQSGRREHKTARNPWRPGW